MEVNLLTFGIEFGAGLTAFASPCCLPLVPAYLSYLTGVSLEQFSRESLSAQRGHILRSAAAFVVGLALVFTLLGASAGLVGQVLLEYQDWLARIAGIVIIIFGLQALGVLRLRLFQQEKRLDFTKRRAPGFLGSLLMGSAFGVGWTPCVGPFLGGILLLAS